MTRPSISVVLPTHNGAKFLDRAIGSVVAQTWEDWELLVVNDASTDGTAQKIEAWVEKDERVRSLPLDRNLGLPAALNAGFRLAQGANFTWTSDDNWYRPDALAKLLDALDAEPRSDVVFSSYTEVDENGTPRCERPARWRDDLVLGNRIGPCFLYRRAVDTALDGYAEDLALAEDYDFWLRAARRFRFKPIDESLYCYRIHADSLTTRRGEAIETASMFALERHLRALDRRERGRALVTLGTADLLRNKTRRGWRRLGQAIALGRWPLFHAGFRLVLLDLALGPRIGKWLRSLGTGAHSR
jgi:glycosyltransferase involved in cell wall biosynthesis